MIAKVLVDQTLLALLEPSIGEVVAYVPFPWHPSTASEGRVLLEEALRVSTRDARPR